MLKKLKPWLAYLILLGASATLSCGTKNSFKELEKEDPAQDAATQLEKRNPDKAIDILEDALEDDDDNYIFISLLSAAYAQKYEVDIIDLALAMADPDASTEADGEKVAGIAVLWPYLPLATNANVRGVEHAVDLLVSIPSASRTEADKFKLLVLTTAAMSLRLKSFDKNGDNVLSTQELLNISADDALAILEGLANAAGVVADLDGQGSNAVKAANKITEISDSIDEQAGGSAEEKLKNYFQEEQN